MRRNAGTAVGRGDGHRLTGTTALVGRVERASASGRRRRREYGEQATPNVATAWSRGVEGAGGRAGGRDKEPGAKRRGLLA